MRFFLLPILLILPVFSYSQQQESSILSDTTLVVGIIKENTFIGNTITSYCSNGFDKQLDEGITVIISGIQICSKSYSDDRSEFYEILHDNKTYYVERDKIETDASFFGQIERMSKEKADKFKAHASYIEDILYKDKIKKALQFIDNCKVRGLAILDWSFYDESEYTEGTSIKFRVYNPTSKTIKYIWFTVIGYNPVGDKVTDIRKGSSITVKAVGPIKREESGLYEFDYVWLTDMVETMKVSTIKIQYMDNSIRTVTNVKEITLPNEMYRVLKDD